MDTERYCQTLDNLNKEKAIKAIHQAYLQLLAINDFDRQHHYFLLDNKPALNSLQECLKDAGHLGFID